MLKLQADGPRYDYVGAGMFSLNHHGIGIYIKYKTNRNAITLHQLSSRHMVISCPDRDLYIVGDRHFAQGQHVPFDYDEFVNLSPFWPVTGAATGITQYMMNRTQFLGKEHLSPKMRQYGRQPEHNQMIWADSGGYQIQNERFDYISPHGLIEWYNENVDIGMVMDFPPGGMYWPGLIEQMAKAQSKCIDIMQQYKRDDLELMNVFHGQNQDEVNRFRSIVERADIERVAIGGAYYANLLQSIDHACRIMLTGRKYPHYHLLGVSNIKQLYLVIRMATKKIAPYITSDSSTFLQEALNKGYYVWPAVSEPPRYYKIGDKTNYANAGKILPCSCAVCSAVKYQDVFGVFSGNVLSFLMMYHNLHAFTSLTKAMYDIIDQASLKDLKSLLRQQLSTRANGRDEVLAGLDYVDEVAENGVESGAAKLAYFLGGIGGTGIDSNSEDILSGVRTLFSSSPARDEGESDGGDIGTVLAVSADNPRRLRMERILNRYIDAPLDSGQSSVKVKKKELIKTTKGHSMETASAIRIPGKRMVLKKPKTPEQQAKIDQKKNIKHRSYSVRSQAKDGDNP